MDRNFSLTILSNLGDLYPKILPELKSIIESRWDFETPAFHSRAKKILKKIQALQGRRTPVASKSDS